MVAVGSLRMQTYSMPEVSSNIVQLIIMADHKISSDTFNTNVIHVGILLFHHENKCSFDVRFRKYVDILPFLLHVNYTRIAREDNIF